jgi:hypothetical protein
MESRENSLTKPKNIVKIKKLKEEKKQELYGLDIDFLKELNLVDMISDL